MVNVRDLIPELGGVPVVVTDAYQALPAEIAAQYLRYMAISGDSGYFTRISLQSRQFISISALASRWSCPGSVDDYGFGRAAITLCCPRHSLGASCRCRGADIGARPVLAGVVASARHRGSAGRPHLHRLPTRYPSLTNGGYKSATDQYRGSDSTSIDTN